MKLDSFFKPKSIAVIGASKDKTKLGWQILNNVKSSGYTGHIYPVNLKANTILGLRNYTDVSHISSPVDVALIVIPAKLVLSEVEKCAKQGIKNLVIISAGFSESGKDGKGREKKLLELRDKYNLNILGPNSLGYLNFRDKINLSFADYSFSNSGDNSGISVLSQSGAIGSALLDWLKSKDINLNHFVSLGNKAGLKENEVFEFLSQDKSTNLVVAYLEEISRGKEFLEVVSKISKYKPVLILKSGQSKAGEKAALSHTGSMTGSTQAVNLALKRTGTIQVSSLQELFNFIEFWQVAGKDILSQAKNQELYIVSNAGGPGVITTDLISKYNLKLGKVSSKLKQSLSSKLGQNFNLNNPLDILGDAQADRYKICVEEMLKQADINNILVISTPQTSTETTNTIKELIRLQAKYPKKNIFPCFLGGKEQVKATQELSKHKLINFVYPEIVLSSLSKMMNYKQSRKDINIYKPGTSTKQDSKSKVSGNWDYLEAFKLLKKYNLEVAKTQKINKKSKLNSLKYPVILKAGGKNLVHKTEHQAIKLNLNSVKEAKQAFQDLSKLKAEYIVSQPKLEGLEMILGFKRDKNFGPILMIGWGGVYTEIIQDFVLSFDDLTKTQAKTKIKQLKVYNLITGYRDKPEKNLDKLTETFTRIAKIARENPDIKELDINPLFLTQKQAKISDVRIVS